MAYYKEVKRESDKSSTNERERKITRGVLWARLTYIP